MLDLEEERRASARSKDAVPARRMILPDLEERRASARFKDALPARRMILPTPDPSPGPDEGADARLPRGAIARDYDLSVAEDYEIWSFNKSKIIKGRQTAAAEVIQEKAELARSAWDFDEPLSELSSSEEESESEHESDRPAAKPRKERKQQSKRKTRPPPKWAEWTDQLPTPPESNDGDYDAPPPLKKLKTDVKEFLDFGLYYAGDGVVSAMKRPAASAVVLPLPMFYGQTLLTDDCEFRLPYDVIHDYSLAGEGRKRVFERLGRDLKPPSYVRIDKNYFPERHKLPADPKAICFCKAGDSCGPDCINRMMFYLCSPDLCPAGETCTNLPLAYRQPALVRPFWTGTRGFGLKTLVDLEEGQFIMEYCGEVISKEESLRRVAQEYSENANFYLLDYDNGEVLDAGAKGNYARFANHNCDPNVVVTRWKFADLDEFQIGLFAARDIPAGTELCYNYNWETIVSESSTEDAKTGRGAAAVPDESTMTRCMCGAKNCIGWLGAKRKSREEQAAEARMAARVATKITKRKTAG